MKRLLIMLVVLPILGMMVGFVSAQDSMTRADVRGGLVREILQATATETGLEISDIVVQLIPPGATLADVIVANGGSVDVVVAHVVTSATERINQAVSNNSITQEQADKLLANLEQLVTDGINGELPMLDNFNLRQNAQHALITAVTESTGMEGRAIIQEIREGKTLAQIITDSGSSVEAVVGLAMEMATERVNGWVANERLTQEQADSLLANLEQAYTDIINGEFEDMVRDRMGDRDNPNRTMGILRKIADDTGLMPRELLSQLRDGATPAEILTEAGLDIDSFVDELLVGVEERLDDAVESERLTREQADERLETIRTTLMDRLNNPINPRGE